jgi:hypothetical protein
MPGILQSPIIEKIGVSSQVRDELTNALAQGRSVTAKVRWGPTGDQSRNRWIAFTPLIGSHKQIGVWIAILVDEDFEREQKPRQAPPVKFRFPKRDLAAQKPSATAPRRPAAAEEQPPLPPPKPASITSLVPEIDENYETLEQRLRKKRERDAARLLEQPGGAPVKPTYKSLSPYAFMNNDGP